MQNTQNIISALKQLKEMGIQIAMDDFGKGYSSLSHLRQLPIDKIKIDRSFTWDINTVNGANIMKAAIAMGKSLNLRVLAEGVENGEQLEFLKTHGCDEAQGYLFSRPLPAIEVTKLLDKYQVTKK
ncbi:EAL domain-containing protein [Desulfotomaculum nigrificans]|uniref:EAL domain-containing protein n=1 Tax=Desulfotomaculum nigrificans TaxID=1565 RepID=UPI0002F822C4|nr:EAL domain-containing protein [Desulfotomaculum nigrificans]